MKTFTCIVCGFTYDEAKGMPEAGINPGTKWEDLPDDWTCPLCGASKAEFEAEAAVAETPAMPISKTIPAAIQTKDDEEFKELSAREMSILCSNLARGCEKQYKFEEQALFTQLAEHFESVAAPATDASFDLLLSRIEDDLATGIPTAKAVASASGDRGALRALTWDEKVTRILKSLLARYAKEGEAMLANTNVYVCTICGYIYIGNTPPDLCPVCKVFNWKFQKIEGGAA